MSDKMSDDDFDYSGDEEEAPRGQVVNQMAEKANTLFGTDDDEYEEEEETGEKEEQKAEQKEESAEQNEEKPETDNREIEEPEKEQSNGLLGNFADQVADKITENKEEENQGNIDDDNFEDFDEPEAKEEGDTKSADKKDSSSSSSSDEKPPESKEHEDESNTFLTNNKKYQEENEENDFEDDEDNNKTDTEEKETKGNSDEDSQIKIQDDEALQSDKEENDFEPQKIEEEDNPIKVAPPSQPPSGRSSSRVPRTAQSSQNLTPKERALRLLPIVGLTDQEYDDLTADLAEDRRQQIAAHHFEEGNKLNKALNHVAACKEKQKKNELQQKELKKYHEMKEEFEQELKDFDQETEDLVNDMKAKQERQLEMMIKQQEKEDEDHYVKWMSEAKQRQYNHASYQLVINRRQLQHLLDQCRFTEAQQVQKIVDRLEAQEEEVAHKTMQHDYNESTKKLHEKHNLEIEFFQQNAQVKLTQLKQRREIARVVLNNKEKKIEAIGEQASDAEKVWNSAQTQRIMEISKKTDRAPPSVSTTAPSRKERTSTVIKLPPLVMQKPVRKTTLSQSAR